VFRNASWTALRTISQPKCTKLQDFTYNLTFFSGGDTPGPPQVSRWLAPLGWTQTPISAWLAGVPIVPVLRNDHWRRNVITRPYNSARKQNLKREIMNIILSSCFFLRTHPRGVTFSHKTVLSTRQKCEHLERKVVLCRIVRQSQRLKWRFGAEEL